MRSGEFRPGHHRAVRLWGAALAAVLLAVLLAFGPAVQAQPNGGATPSTPATPAAAPAAKPSPAPPPNPAAAAVEKLRPELDDIEKALGNENHFDDALAALRHRLTPLRGTLRESIDTLQDDLDQATSQLKQLGDPPGEEEPKEDPGIAAERARLAHQQSEIDAALKQAKLMAVRADDASTRVSDLRRSLFARELFARTTGLFQSQFWRDLADGIPAEGARLAKLGQAWWVYASSESSRASVVGAAVTLAGFGLVGFLVFRWLRRRLIGGGRFVRFDHASQALLVLLVNAVRTPLAVLVAVLVLENYGLMPAWLRSIWAGITMAIATASTSRGVARGLFARWEPGRRLFAWSDAEANRIAKHLTWSARFLALAMTLILVHKATSAPIALTVATSAALAVTIVAIVIHFLWSSSRPGAAEPAPGPGLGVVRVVLVLFVAAILGSLATGYVALAAFLAGRLVIVFTFAGVLVVMDAFVDAFFTQVLSGASERGRAVAALLGLTQRGLDLIATLLSAVIRVVLLVFAILAVMGPWGVFADDVLSRLAEAAFGLEIAGATISLQTVLGAIALLLIGIVVVRAAQRWLKTSFLPRTALDPGLQHSISALFGYAGMIAVLAAVLGALGIDLQKIALIAGALSVGIGFGLQSIVSNFVSGLILLAERPVRVGDWIVLKSDEGYVRKISVRSTEIETFDRASVIVPNSELITGTVKNWTHANTLGRVILKVRVAYDTDVDQVREILAGCARAHPLVLKAPPPGVYLLGFGEIGLDFELRCILANVENGLTVRSDLHVAVLRAFREAGIKIPYPPHDEKVPGPSMIEDATL